MSKVYEIALSKFLTIPIKLIKRKRIIHWAISVLRSKPNTTWAHEGWVPNFSFYTQSGPIAWKGFKRLTNECERERELAVEAYRWWSRVWLRSRDDGWVPAQVFVVLDGGGGERRGSWCVGSPTLVWSWRYANSTRQYDLRVAVEGFQVVLGSTRWF